MLLTCGMEKEYQEKIATLTAEKEELTEQMQHIATEHERTVAELHHKLAKLQLQVEEAEEARRQEGKTLEEIRQLHHENQELQRRMYETEELIHLQKEQVAVMHDSMQDLRQQKNDYRERQQEWRLLAEKREKENQNLRVELEKEQKRWTVERENIETKAWVPLQGAKLESIHCEQPREQGMPGNERDPSSLSTYKTAPAQTGLLTSSASITQPERPLSAVTTSTSSVIENSLVPTGAAASVPTKTSVAKIAESNLYQLFQSTTQPYSPTVQ